MIFFLIDFIKTLYKENLKSRQLKISQNGHLQFHNVLRKFPLSRGGATSEPNQRLNKNMQFFSGPAVGLHVPLTDSGQNYRNWGGGVCLQIYLVFADLYQDKGKLIVQT